MSSDDPCDCLVPTSIEREATGVGALAGLRFVAKDLFAVEGHTSSFGHPTWRDTHTPSTITAPAVAALLAAGGDLVGMTKMDQLAYSLIGNVGEGDPPRNTIDPDLFCGGSSSGSAAAVAAGMADVALGTDTAGSIRVPAAVCGVFGLRPTHGVLSSAGVLPLAPSFDAAGLFANRASVLRQAFGVLAPDASRPSDRPLNVLVATDLFDHVDEETALIGQRTADRAGDLVSGSVADIAFDEFTDPDTGNLFARLQGREIWDEIGSWVTAHVTSLADDVQTRLGRCEELSRDPADRKLADERVRDEYRTRFAESVPPGTVVVLPVLPAHGPKREWSAEKLVEFRTGCFRLTSPASLAGAPQAVINARAASGRSIGIGLLAAPGEDHLLLDLLAKLDD